MLTDIIPASWRKGVYAVFALISTIEAAVQLAFVTADKSQPMWLIIAVAVTAFLGLSVGAMAASNTPLPIPARAIQPAPVAPSATANADGTVTSVDAAGTSTTV